MKIQSSSRPKINLTTSLYTPLINITENCDSSLEGNIC